MDSDDPDGDDGPRLIKTYCRLTDHNWETCVNGDYVDKGVLFRRSCLYCTAKFQSGKRPAGLGKGKDAPKDKYWVSLSFSVSYCTYCKVCLCKVCHPEFLKNQGGLSETRSPRRSKKPITYGR